MKEVMALRDKKIKITLRWNEEGQPDGKEAKLLISFVGMTVSKIIPITTKDWAFVEEFIFSKKQHELKIGLL